MKYYSLPITEGEVVLHISATARKELLLELLVSLLTVMVVSIFLTVELVMFALQFLENKLIAPSTQSPDEPPRCQALEYIRPLAFVFFFSSKITSSFIPLVAQDLGGELFGITGDMLSSIPQSSETLFTCFAIFLTSVLIEKRGWKLPFVGGLCLVAGGSLLSAFSFHIVVYILARSVVGLGYGFAWMTLRNLSLFGRNAEEKTMGFSLLNAGIYAGVNCGSVLGSVLAETLGYQLVFLLSAAFTVLCSLTILQMENAIYKRPVAEKPALTDGDALQKTHALPKHNALQKNRTRQKYSAKQLVIVSAFVLLMIAPTTIAGGFLSYYLPLYFTNIGYGVSDVGRAQLLYGITIIYLGPTLAKFVNVKKWTYLYSLLIAVTFIGFGLFGGIVGAMIAVLMLGIADSFGFVMQNNYFLNYKVLQPLGESVSLSMLSFIKKITEMLGPITFALFMSGTQTSTICLLGGLFFIGTMVYIVFFGSKAELLEG